MKNNIIYDNEFTNRYLYLLENKELILSLCIDYGIEKEYYRNKISECKNLLRKLKDKSSNEYKLVNSSIIEYKVLLKEPKPYLMDNISPKITKMFKEFLLSDISFDKTNLYKCIERIKNNGISLERMNRVIEFYKIRREKNMYLRNTDAFPVWKIIDYVRKDSMNNPTALKALDKYYNFDRYFLTGINWDSGYYLEDAEAQEKNMYLNLYQRPYLCSSSSYDSVIYSFYKNEFEVEPSYLTPKENKDKVEIIKQDDTFESYLANKENYTSNEKLHAKLILNERNLDKRIVKSLNK